MRKSSKVIDGGDGKPAPPQIDFSSPDFNRIDDLQDCGGNYRSFESLGGIITADVRHRFARERTGDPAQEEASAAATVGAPVEQVAEVAETAPVTVTSLGRVLVLARDAEVAEACRRILEGRGMSCTVVVTGDGATAPALPSESTEGARTVEVRGAFGRFTARRRTGNGAGTDLIEPNLGGGSRFDCVLDLQPTRSYAGPLLPAGYYAPGEDPASPLAELPEMRGRFEKPRFTVFIEGRCLRGRSRTADCGRCIEICPFGAIEPAARGVTTDHVLCQGCGACALVCPADALRLLQPSPGELIGRLGRMLESTTAKEGLLPEVTICEADDSGRALKAAPGGDCLPRAPHAVFAVDQICHVRLETLLSAFVHGAGSVVVACPETTPRIEEAVRAQTILAAAILRGLGFPGDTVRCALASPPTCDSERPGVATPGARNVAWSARPTLPEDGAKLVRAAAQALYDRSGAQDPSLPLPEGAPFGALELAADRCTLCMACAAACPTGALVAPGDVPRLEFRESRCHQCGLCVKTCPERALLLVPRLLCDPQAVARPSVLREEKAARCLDCGSPFASQAMIDAMRAKLRGHWMYVEERQVRRLQLCRTCRARDAFVSGDVRQWAP